MVNEWRRNHCVKCFRFLFAIYYLLFTIYYLIVWRLYIYYLAIYYLLFAVWLFTVLTVCYLVVYGLLSRGFGELDGLLPCLGGIPVRNFCRIFVNDMFFFME